MQPKKIRSYDNPTRKQHHETALLAAVARFCSEGQKVDDNTSQDSAGSLLF